ncbi:MAG: hypothetical protein M1825_003502 [Sarcosagium campestre]|nr:MAG: hypothetical protein M1825_003502 [Sarcosagium campestre]
MAKTVLIVGGSYVGLGLAHKLLKRTYPAVKGDFKVVLVSSSTHMYWNMASVRGVVPNLISDEALFMPIEPAFERYPKGSFEFVEGTASKLDDNKKALVVKTPSGERTVSYDHIVIATGASSSDNMPWKYAETYEKTRENLHAVQKAIEAASDIVVGGGGPTGVETAAEIGDEYKKAKKVTLITSGAQTLSALRKDIGAFADRDLASLGIEVIHNTTINSATTTAAGKTELKLSTGETLTTDLYIPTIGVKPNTSFVPANLLDEGKNVKVDEFLRVAGTENAWAAGDVTGIQSKQIKFAEEQLTHLAANLDLVLKGKEPTPYKQNNMTMMAASLGKGRGTGQAGWFKLPSLLVYFAKGKTLGLDKAAGFVAGDRLIMAGSV